MGYNNVKYTQEEVSKFYKDKNCILIDEYKNAATPMRYICSCGKENYISFDKFRRQKHGCRYCTKIGGYSKEEVFEYFKEQGCILLTEYTGCKNKMDYICSCGEKASTTFDNFLHGKRCKKCGIQKLRESFKHDINFVKDFFIKSGCIPLFEEYNNSKEKLKYICSCGNESFIAFGDFYSGKRCGNCRVERINLKKRSLGNAPSSSQQKFLFDIIGGEENYPIGNYLLDIALPEEKIYIEYDGSGHDLSVKLGHVSEIDFRNKEIKRNYFLFRRGWKEIRIISNKDKLPNKKHIEQMISFAKNIILSGRSYVVFNIDDSTIEYQSYNSHYDFGKLERVRND